MVKAGLCIDQFLAGDHRCGFDDIECPRRFGIGQQRISKSRCGIFICPPIDHRVERQLCSGPDDRLQFGSRTDAGHLDQNPVRTLTLDGRFARAHLVDTAADNLERLLHRPFIGRLFFGVRQGDGDNVTRAVYHDVVLARTRNRLNRTCQSTRRFQRWCHLSSVADPNAQFALGGLDPAHRCDRP